jgi:DNA replication and repair protein RecF
MRVLQLGLTNFRNYTRLQLDLPAGTIVLQGDNAQGKTNLLEAIYYLSRIGSPRTKADRELVNWLVLNDDLPFARLVAQIQTGEETDQIELSLVQANGNRLDGTDSNASVLRKHIRINGVNKRAADAVGLLSAVLFLPQDIDLVSGAPQLRRRYLDDTIPQIDLQYRRELQRYNRVLTRRNHLLRSFRGYGADPAQLVFWDQRLVEHGAYLIALRRQLIQQLSESAQNVHSRITGEKEWLRLKYCSSVRLGGQSAVAYQMALPTGSRQSPQTETVPEIAALFSEQLRNSQAKELEQGMSIIGPHRDDFQFLVDDVDMNTYGSRGQQRTAALSLKLAEVEWITREKGDKPVLLLDDVISELDATHRRCLLETIDQAQQVILTTTDLTHYSQEFLNQATLWRVQEGRIEKLIPP